MKCAFSFLSVFFLVVSVGAIAVYILWMTQECQQNFFTCFEDNTCIPYSKYCDNKKDCPNGSDEIPYECADLTNINSLISVRNDASTNRITTPEPPPCQSLSPSVCTVEEIKCGIECKNVSWQSFPVHLFDNSATRMKLINMAGESDTFSWTNATSVMGSLKLLLIQHHQHLSFHDFPWDLFTGNQQLVNIYVEWNNIGFIPNRIFSNMHSLRRLFLADNRLETIGTECFVNLTSLLILDLSYNRLQFKDYTFHELPKLRDLLLRYNRITNLSEDMFCQLSNLEYLDLRGNQIDYIHDQAFRGNIVLAELILSENKLRTIQPVIFQNIATLTKLNLGFNPLHSFVPGIFCVLGGLQSLNLTDIDIPNIERRMFLCLKNLTYAHFKKFQYCRYAPHVPICYPNSNGLSSLKNLLVAKTLRLIIWVIAVLTVCGNVTVLIGRYFATRPSRILDIFVSNLAGADILTGFYLIVIALKDIELRNNYNSLAYEWSTSWLCQSVGVIAMISCEVSLLILTVMSLERYLVISGRSGTKLSRKLAIVSMSLIWIFVIALAITPGKTSFYGSSGLCFPLHMDDPFSLGWEYTAFVFIGLNSVCLILITFSYGKLYWVIRKTRLAMPAIMRDVEMALTIRFFFMVLSDFVCWLPIILLKVAVIAGYEIHQDVHAWLLVFVLPLNSTVNPFLYTFSTGSVGIKCFQQLLASCTAGITPIQRESFEQAVGRNNGTMSETPLCVALCKQKIKKEDGRASTE